MTHNITDLLEILNTSKQSIKIGDYTITELTLNEQKELLNIFSEPLTSLQKTQNVFNKIIENCVKSTKPITIYEKPFLIRAIRDLSFNKVLKFNDIECSLNDINYNIFLNNIEYDKEIKLNEYMTFNLSIPSLELETNLNYDLINYINKNINKEIIYNSPTEQSKVSDIFINFEIMKYIKNIKVNNDEYEFMYMSLGEKLKVVNSLTPNILEEINEFILKAHIGEIEAFKAIIKDSNENIIIPMNYSIFSKEIIS